MKKTSSKNSFKDISDDIELLDQKAAIIEQMVQFSLNSKPAIQNKKEQDKNQNAAVEL